MAQTVEIRLLKDGSGRVCIHWFRRTEEGPIKTPVDVRITPYGPLQLGGAVGTIACHPKQNTVTPQKNGHVTQLCCHSDDVRAVTCPSCCATQEYKDEMERYAGMLDSGVQSAPQPPAATEEVVAAEK